MEEARWEHHTVASVPEFWLILIVEGHDISGACKSESAEDHVCGDEPNEEARVVKSGIVHANKSREHHSLHSNLLQGHKPEVVHQFHLATKRVLSHLTLTDGQQFEEVADGSTTLRETLIDEVLQSCSVTEDQSLDSLGHFYNY